MAPMDVNPEEGAAIGAAIQVCRQACEYVGMIYLLTLCRFDR